MYEKSQVEQTVVEREEAVLRLWQELGVQERRSAQLEAESTGEYVIYDGPPTANGKPHIGHILTRAIKDVYPRFQAMQGKRVQFKAGWDTHGLPVELEVEKLLGIDGKPEIEAYGIEAFIRKCKESVWKYKDEWEQMSARVGYWADMKEPYVTYENNYIESVWWSLKKFWEQGLLYEGHKIVPYCPRCGTSLSSHEVAQGYKDVKEMSVFVRFPVRGEQGTYLAAWTTTPWTLPSNVALCVNPDETYLLIELTQEESCACACGCSCGCSHEAHEHGQAHGHSHRHPALPEGRYYVVESLAERVFGSDFRVLRRCRGQELEGLEYEPLFPYARNTVEASGKRAWYVTADSYVTTADGTGIVHIAPAFGEDDAAVGRRYDLPFVQLVAPDGKMSADCEDLAGVFCKDADPRIMEKLAERGLLLLAVPYEHSYPFCWRCDTPLIYYARHSWFIRMTELRRQLVANNEGVNWIPPSIGSGRFGNFLENVVDWGLSRERYWGTPLPVWICKDCGKLHVIGSIEELKSMAVSCPEDIELHRPYIDQVELHCPHCSGGRMQRVSEVIDCWYDSGSMPFAQFHYPFENKDYFESHFPAQFISEALDQTRGWFYSLMAISTGIFGKSPYQNCEVLGLVQDRNGQKMSKHKGNVVDPWTVLNKQGADALRWYFYTNSNPWLPSRFSDEALMEGQRRFLGTLWNTCSFYLMYAEIDQFDPSQHSLRQEGLPVMDRWVLSRLQSLTATVTERLEHYDVTAAGRALDAFVDELSNWYVRRGRERYWAGAMDQDKIDAYMTLYTVLEQLLRLAAPFVPFITESMYQRIVRAVDKQAPLSVHLCRWPQVDARRQDAQLEEEMSKLLQIVGQGRSARNMAGLKNRQPLRRLYVSGLSLDSAFWQLALDELNVREYHEISDPAELEDYAFKPQLRSLGRRFGKRLGQVTELLRQLDGRAAMRELKTTGALTLVLDGQEERLTEEDLLVETRQAEGLASDSQRGVTVALDTQLDTELLEEGLLRELVSKLQTMRKEAGYAVTDRIVVSYAAETELADLLARRSADIQDDVLALSMQAEETLGQDLDPAALKKGQEQAGRYIKRWSINGHSATLATQRQEH